MAKRKRKNPEYLKKTLLFLIKIPYFAIKGIYNLSKKINEKNQESEVKKKRESIDSKYEGFKIIKKIKGDLGEFNNKFYSCGGNFKRNCKKNW